MTTDFLTQLPHVDVQSQDGITEAQAAFFRQNGVLMIRNLLDSQELSLLQSQTASLIKRATEKEVEDPDWMYRPHSLTGQRIPHRIEYVIDKLDACKALLGHPFILRSIEKLQGRNFIPTFDSCVFKVQGMGCGVPWHRDGGVNRHWSDHTPILNVDFYLDEADRTNCVWCVPGSNTWSAREAAARIEQLNQDGFQTDEQCVAVPMQPGDVLFHDIDVLHGSAPAQSNLRRTLYYEFRSAEDEIQFGPHNQAYLPLKQTLLRKCIWHRRQAAYSRGETPFEYQPAAPFVDPPFDPATQTPETYRYPHEAYRRR